MSSNSNEEKKRGLHNDEQEREAESSTASPSPSPSILRQWAEDIFASTPPGWLSPSSCGSGCLAQVVDDWGEEDVAVNKATDDDTVANTSHDSRKGHRSSLFNDDGIAAAPSTESSRPSPSTTRGSAGVQYDESARIAEKPENFEEGIEVPTEQDCPLCHETMSTFDILYPIQCPTRCGYNFCFNCMNLLLASSKEDYQVASDGSRHVKVRLNCPNCRAGIEGIIEDVIRSRKESSEESSDEDLEVEIEQNTLCISTADSYCRYDAVIEAAFANCSNTNPRIKNRSSAPRRVRHKRVNYLIETIESMATPSSLRAQVLAAHGQVARHDTSTSSTASWIDDGLSLSQSSSSSVEAQVVQPLSFTISSPVCTRSPSSDAVEAVSPSSSVITPSRTLSYERLSSPQVNRLAAPCELRRSQSLEAPYVPPELDLKKSSPKSVLDLTSFYPDHSSGDHQTEEAERSQAHSTVSQGKTVKESKFCLEGISFKGGEGGFFSDTVDLDWCCFNDYAIPNDSVEIKKSALKEAPSEGCGGYVDYSGIYHPCTNVGRAQKQVHGEQERGRIMELEETCQGCIFRRGTHDGNETEEKEEDLYYDSDTGQHFAIASWTLSPTAPPLSPSRSHNYVDEKRSSLLGMGARTTSHAVKKAKRRWRRKRKGHDKSNRDGNATDVDISQDCSNAQDDSTPERRQGRHLQRSQEDQQAYLYDYFSRSENICESPLRTGFCFTNDVDISNIVQVALNSKWRLQWHVNKKSGPRSSKKALQPPMVCDLWIERGFRRNRTEIVEPKLMWCQPKNTNEKLLEGSTIRPFRVSLFAIRRICQVATGEEWATMKMCSKKMKDTPSTPMAKLNCLLVIKSSLGEDYLFEASCSEERDRIVHLLKMTTARLVSHAVVGNGDLMIREYFNEEFVAGGMSASLIATTDGC